VKFLQATFISLLAVLAPIKSVLLVTGFLIFADLLSGVLAARKRGEKITSAGFRRTISKLLIYNLAVISGFLVETYMVSNLLPISKLISGVIALVELKSVLENLNTVNGTNIFKTVLFTLDSKNMPQKGDSEEPPTV